MQRKERAIRIATLRAMFVVCAEKCIEEERKQRSSTISPEEERIREAKYVRALMNEFMELIEEDVKDRG